MGPESWANRSSNVGSGGAKARDSQAFLGCGHENGEMEYQNMTKNLKKSRNLDISIIVRFT
jgi:hypothetical protein